jgi:beta-glucosidase
VPIAHTALRTRDGKEGLTGEYFASPDLSGKPVAVRVDRTVNFNWDKAVPVPGLARNNFSVRWTGSLAPPAPGDYKLGARVAFCYACESNEQFRVYLDDELIADASRPERAEAAVRFESTKPRALRLEYRHGTAAAGIDLTWQAPASVLAAEAVAAAKESEVVIAFVGLSPQLEGEEMPVELEGFKGGDRTDIRLPRVQRELLQALKATGKPLVVVLTSGSALALPDEHRDAAAVLEAWYPGEEGGTAIAETLAGDNNPAGRLPLTFYASVDQLPPFEEYSMANRTYRYFAGKPLYGFGYGLSYSRFEYANLTLSSRSLSAGEGLSVEVDVTNASSRAGDEVVQLYLTPPKAALTPLRTLAGFSRVHVDPGRTAHVAFPLDPRTLAQVDEKGERVVVSGTYGVAVGGAQPAEFPGAATATFEVTGSQTLPR